MDEDELGFELYAEVEDMGVESFDDVQELVDEGLISAPQHYDFEGIDEFMSFFIHEVDASDTYRMLQQEGINKWRTFLNRYDEAGNVLYNPENNNQWYTDDEDLVHEGI